MVLFVSYSRAFGGAERVLVDFASDLERECAIACPPGPLEETARHAGLRTFALRPRGLQVRRGPRTRVRATADLGGHALELQRLTRSVEPEVLVLWGMRSAIASLALRHPGAMAFQHNDFLPGPLIGALVRQSARRCSLITAPSRAVLDDLDLPGEVIAPGVDIGDGAPPASREVLVLGALVPWKRPDLALEAFALAHDRHPDARLTLAGSPLPGDDRAYLESLRARAEQPDLKGAVRFAGHVADPRAELARCAVLLHCADREPFGMAVAEALAVGRPAVVPDAAGPAEIVTEGCGLRYPPGDVRAAADALERVLADPASAARMGEAGRARAAEHFDRHRQRVRYRDALARLGTRGRSASSPEVTIVTVTHNSAAVLPGFLASVARHLPSVAVIVADAGSSDASRTVVSGRPHLTLLEFDNVGFGAACNRAVAEVRTPVVALLNPDVELIDDTLLAMARAATSDAPARLLAPRVLNSDGSVQDTVHPAPLSAAEVVRALVPPALVPGPWLAPWRSGKPRRVGWAVACALVARTDTLRALGPFEERLFLYGEDMELGLRAAREGVETWLWPAARVIHHGGHSTEAAHGGEPVELRARARHEALALALGPRVAGLDDRLQAATFASRRALKRALGLPAERERRQLEAVRSLSWETFAHTDPQYYIDPTLGPGVALEEFRESGRGIVEWAVEWAGELPGHERALEIGCGLGRNTVHLARHFGHVDGVDVSGTMVRRARERGLPANVALHALSGRDLRPLPDAGYAMAFSHLVFQHVEPLDVIASYLREIARVLQPRGVAVLQFDTRPRSPGLRQAYRLPDRLLPRANRRGIRRHRRDAQVIRGLAEQAGLTIEEELGVASAAHWLRLRRPQ